MQTISTIKIDTVNKQIKINNKVVNFSSIQFCYYYYFIRRAKYSQSFIHISGTILPREISNAVYNLHKSIYPEEAKYRREFEETMNNGITVVLNTTAKAHFSKLNKKILIPAFRITHTGQPGSRSYGIQCNPEAISISTTTVIPTFENKVHVFNDKDTLDEVLRFMERNQYSQVVVRHNNRLRLITPESILRWLQNKTTHRATIIDLSNIFLSDLSYTDSESFVTFFKKDRFVDEARKEFFERFSSNAPRLSAILITSNGTSTGTPLGIITPWDFIDKKYW